MASGSSIHRQLQVGVIGLGRMGFHHARNVAYFSPRCKLVAVCDIYQPLVDQARTQLPPDVAFYPSTEALIADTNVEAVVIVSATDTHVPLALAALRAGKHVLMEKPISTSWDTTAMFVKEVEKYPDQKVMVGMARRFDESYAEAKARIDNGQLGPVFMVKSASNDVFNPEMVDTFVQYAAKSGGIFVDAGIHDIDMARWLLQIEADDKVKRVFATGTIAKYHQLAQYQDVDNAIAVVEFRSGKMFTFHTGRTTSHGHECVCEVIGDKGRFVINQNPRRNRLDIADDHGVRTPATATFYERLKDAFGPEINAFAECVLDDKPSPVPVSETAEAEKIAHALMTSLRTQQPVLFDQSGQAVRDMR